MTDTLIDRIENTRITYSKLEHGVRISGAPFVCEFDDRVDPAAFYDTIATPAEPWRLFAVQNALGDGYCRIAAVLYHIEDDEFVDASPVDLEVCSEWVRVYVKKEACAARVAEFIAALDSEYGITTQFSEVTS